MIKWLKKQKASPKKIVTVWMLFIFVAVWRLVEGELLQGLILASCAVAVIVIWGRDVELDRRDKGRSR